MRTNVAESVEAKPLNHDTEECVVTPIETVATKMLTRATSTFQDGTHLALHKAVASRSTEMVPLLDLL